MTLTAGSSELAAHLARLCPEHRIDLAGVVPLPCPLPLADRYRKWLDEGRHGDLDYMRREPRQRLDPTLRSRDIRSLLVFAQRYTDGWPAGDPDPTAAGTGEGCDGRAGYAGGAGDAAAPWTGRVARYARGLDYHDVLLPDIKGVLAGLGKVWPGLVARASCDTGPFFEREYAWLAGLGFLGKNTCLIHERLGSGLFLGVAVTNLDLGDLSAGDPAQVAPLYGVAPRRRRPPASAYLNACGSCTRCIDACPTGAIGPEGGLDAGRCLSTWTIEHRGQAPTDQRHRQGGIVFGCDICQAVCPWNQRAAQRSGQTAELPRDAYATLPEHDQLGLVDLVALSAAEFRSRFRRTPIWRCHPAGLHRNALTAAANEGLTDMLELVDRILAGDEPDSPADDPAAFTTRDVASWARRRLTEPRRTGGPESAEGS